MVLDRRRSGPTPRAIEGAARAAFDSLFLRPSFIQHDEIEGLCRKIGVAVSVSVDELERAVRDELVAGGGRVAIHGLEGDVGGPHLEFASPVGRAASDRRRAPGG